MSQTVLTKINDLKQYPLSNTEIERITGYKMLSYSELYNYDNLEHLLHMYNGSVIIMYHQTENYEHYCCLNKLTEKNESFNKKELIEFFDPYGLFPDKQLKFIDYEMNAKLKQNHTYLSYLMYSSPYKLSFNEHRFQGLAVQTCGFHCAHRILYKELLLKEYKKRMDTNVKASKKLIKQKSNLSIKAINYDDLVVVTFLDKLLVN
jgi:hypothetical protein